MPIRLAIALTLCCWLLSGCTQWRYELGRDISETQTPAVEADLTLSDVLAELGPPARISATADGLVLGWEHWRVKEDTIGLSLGPLGADFVSFDWGAARMKGEFILAVFDSENRLTASTFSTWDSEAGGGKAVQPFIGIPITSVRDLIRRLPHHRWGASSLDRLPEALNAANRPDTGQAGIQQRGTPSGIGQQSLEMD